MVLFGSFPISDLMAQCVDNGNQWAKSWVSCSTSANPNVLRGNSHWILYEFTDHHYIDTSYIWNANRTGESGEGVKDVIIDYSLNGSTWTELGSYTFDQAPESDTYDGILGPNFQSQYIKKILITVVSTHNGGSCASIAEIQFNVDNSKCHGIVDECGVCDGPGVLTWYIDADGDGKGNTSSVIVACTQPVGYVNNADDICDDGELSWDDVSLLFINSCTGCHINATSGGLNLGSYASFSAGGDKCGLNIKSGNNLVSVITIDGFIGCGIPIETPAMNTRAGANAMSQSELDMIQLWIDGGAPENCIDFCLENQDISTDFTSGMVAHKKASNQISCNSELHSGTIITFDAGVEILLNSGFVIDQGSEFTAKIGGCEE